MRVVEVGMKRLGQDVLGARGPERGTGSTAGGQQANGRHHHRDSKQLRDHYCWMSDAGGALTICPVLKRSNVAVKVDPCIVLAYFSG